MKILMVNKYLYYKGGAETYFIKIGKRLEELGHKVEYFGMYSQKNIVGNSLKLYTDEMDFHSSSLKRLLYPFKIIYSYDAKKKIKKIIREFKPDIIHLNNINFQLTPSIIEIAYKMRIPIVQTVHDFQMICPNHLLYTNNKICEKCIRGSKWNCSKYNCIHNSKVKSIIGSIEAILYTKILKTYKKVNIYICPSKFLENKLLEASKIYNEKTVAMHNFIELSDFKNTEKEDYVLFFGRLSDEKGLKILLETCKMLPEIKFKIAGTGPLENECKNIKNVEFVGFKTGRELNDLIEKARFSVYPSVWYENCPLSILESESLGTPVLTADYGGMKELVEHKKTGILINKITKESLKKEIEKLYNDKDLLKKMSEQCISKRNNMISLEEYCEDIIKIYKEVMEKKIK